MADNLLGLGCECGVTTIDQMHDIYRKFFGNEELPTKAQLRLSALIEAIQARRRLTSKQLRRPQTLADVAEIARQTFFRNLPWRSMKLTSSI
jgi:hypothetical protein